jgi:hypothetical protein
MAISDFRLLCPALEKTVFAMEIFNQVRLLRQNKSARHPTDRADEDNEVVK